MSVKYYVYTTAPSAEDTPNYGVTANPESQYKYLSHRLVYTKNFPTSTIEPHDHLAWILPLC